MILQSPNSASYFSYDPAQGWQDEYTTRIRYSYVDYLLDCCVAPLTDQQQWMIHGLRSYALAGDANDADAAVLCTAVLSDTLLPLSATVQRDGRFHDLQHFNDQYMVMYVGFVQQDWELGQAQARNLVAFIADNYGGLPKVFDLVRDYTQPKDLARSIQSVLGVDASTLNERWLAAIREQHR